MIYNASPNYQVISDVLIFNMSIYRNNSWGCSNYIGKREKDVGQMCPSVAIALSSTQRTKAEWEATE